MDAESSHQSPEFQPRKVIGQIGTIIRGKEEQIQLALTCLFALPEDLQQVLPWAVGHHLSAQAGSRYFTPNQLLSILCQVPVP